MRVNRYFSALILMSVAFASNSQELLSEDVLRAIDARQAEVADKLVTIDLVHHQFGLESALNTDPQLVFDPDAIMHQASEITWRGCGVAWSRTTHPESERWVDDGARGKNDSETAEIIGGDADNYYSCAMEGDTPVSLTTNLRLPRPPNNPVWHGRKITNEFLSKMLSDLTPDSVSVETEGGFECLKLIFERGPNASIAIWLAKDLGYLIVRHDQFHGTPSRVFFSNKYTFSQSGGIWLPASADLQIFGVESGKAEITQLLTSQSVRVEQGSCTLLREPPRPVNDFPVVYDGLTGDPQG